MRKLNVNDDQEWYQYCSKLWIIMFITVKSMYLIDQQMSWVLSRGLGIAFALAWYVFVRTFVMCWFIV